MLDHRSLKCLLSTALTVAVLAICFTLQPVYGDELAFDCEILDAVRHESIPYPLSMILLLRQAVSAHSSTIIDDVILAPQQASKNDQASSSEVPDIRSIHLRARNWENHGTDFFLSPNGMFEVYSYIFGESRKVRAGLSGKADVQQLINDIHRNRILSLPDEYKVPFQSKFSWWGYELIIETDRDVKSVRFHSEDLAAPDELKSIVQRIKTLAK